MRSKIIGITGGSGCGKSYISDILRSEGIYVADADKIGHGIINESADCRREITEYFGDEIAANGVVDRKKLGKIVFSAPEKLKKLNEITHKYILERIYNEIEESGGEVAAADGALLIESGMKCDVMVGVLADYNVRLERIIRRDGLTREDARQRLNAQQSDDFYKQNCDYIIYNNGGNADIESINKIIKGLCNEKNN